MNRLASSWWAAKRFFSLPVEEKRLLIQAFMLLWAIRIGLWVLPFSTLRGIIQKITPITTERGENNLIPLDRLVWATEVMSCYVPKATCLTKALAGKVLLAGAGYSSSLFIGVAKDGENNFEAHAWLNRDELTIIGKSDRDFKELLSLSEQDL